MRETARQKAARLLIADPPLIRPLKITPEGLAWDVLGDSVDKFKPIPYRVLRYRDERGQLVESCTCEGALHHPIKPRCSHMEAARIVMRLTHGF